MNRRLRLSALVAYAFALTACASSMSVSSHVEQGLDFGRYRTFAWGPADALPTGDPRLDANPFFKDHMQGDVEKGLAARGIALVTSGPSDLQIHYHANISQRMNVRSVDATRAYGNPADDQISEYEAGTIVVDIVDTRTQRVIWRGWAQDAVKGMLNNSDKMADQIQEAVTRMLARLPPKL